MRVSLLKDQQFYLRCFVFVLVGAWCASFIGAVIDPAGKYTTVFCEGGGCKLYCYDFLGTVFQGVSLDPYNPHYSGMTCPYLPLTFLITWPFARLITATGTLSERGMNTTAIAGCFLWIACFSACFFYALNRLRKKYHLPRYVLLGFLFNLVYIRDCLCSANTVFLGAACILLFVCCYDSEDKRERFWAALALACAAALKIHPVLFGLLYLPQKRYKEAFLSTVFTLILAIGPFFFLKSDFSDSVSGLLRIVEKEGLPGGCWGLFTTYSVVRPFERIFFHSIGLFGDAFYKVDLFLCGLAAVCALLQTDFWKRLTLVSILILFAPKVSWYSCYLYMFPSIMLFFATLPTRRGITNIAILTLFVSGMLPFPVAYADENRVLPLSALNMLLLLGYLLISTARDVLRGKRKECSSCQEMPSSLDLEGYRGRS
ncbi:MAG: glycosyltransferase 87 family protein [Holosporales bacterium]|jgi:hypothetical protein|nr:glycosyltransferase 87 family protein [Holosporales bacterium]